MRSPLAALAWEIWRRSRRAACLALGCVSFCALVNLAAPERLRASGVGRELFPTLFGLLMLLSVLLLFGIFNYTEFNSTKEWNGFPYRLFSLPLRTWQLVSLPMLLGVLSLELLYLAWIKLVFSRGEIPMPGWLAVILGAYMVFYQATLWCLAGFRVARVLLLGLEGASVIAVASFPFLGKLYASAWLSEKPLPKRNCIAGPRTAMSSANSPGKRSPIPAITASASQSG